MDTKYFQIGGITITINSEIPFKTDTFHETVKQFEVHCPGKENITINHIFKKTIKPHNRIDEKIYYKKPWTIFKTGETIIYDWLLDNSIEPACHRKIITNKKHTKIDILHDIVLAERFLKGQLLDVSLLPTDQILLGRVLSYKNGCIIHSMGLIHRDKGYLFVGHSSAGKSTMAKIMQNDATILCDDRNIIRKNKDGNGYTLYGTWRHSDFSSVSSLSAPLMGIFFLNQSAVNHLDPIDSQKIRFSKLLSCLVKPLATDDWWDSTINFLDTLAMSVACWDLKFDKSGKISDYIKNI